MNFMNKLFFFGIFLNFSTCFAAPAPHEMLVNEQTKQCADFMAGDECFTCEIPVGWTSLGYGTYECPEGYTQIEVELECSGFKVDRCCSTGHSGAAGACEDMVINEVTQQCAFLDGGEVPSGWKGKPDHIENAQWMCPEGYSWTEKAEPCACAIGFVLLGLLVFSVNAKRI
jgi:hypothetical protein